MSNFNLLKETDFPRKIYNNATNAERNIYAAPSLSAVACRNALECTVNYIFSQEDFFFDRDERLVDKLKNSEFYDFILDNCGHSTHLELKQIRLTGNNGAHDAEKNVSSDDSFRAVKNIFRLLKNLSAVYFDFDELDLKFNESFIPPPNQVNNLKQKIQDLEKEQHNYNHELAQEREDKQQLEEKVKVLLEEQKRLAHKIQTKEGEGEETTLLKKKTEHLEKQLLEDKANDKALRKAIEELKKEKEVLRKKVRQSRAIEFAPLEFNEEETRKNLIDNQLKEAGWKSFEEGKDIEFKVEGMPESISKTGIGYIDYVLWGDDGKPLAIVEAKRASTNSKIGRHQAVIYAECLDKMFDHRPLIYYTNGFTTYFLDDQFYNDRIVFGFHSKDELLQLHHNRQNKKDLRRYKVNKNIAGRSYQLEALRRVAENFVLTDNKLQLRGFNRQSLLVMATGSGKTRTSAALVEMMVESGWVSKVLFLADRVALVKQAQNAFKEHLPTLSPINLSDADENDAKNARLVFSTYPTMMNKINSVNEETGKRFFGIGHFDLIIIDEAHRSVYQKFRSIFQYFDSLLVGLTATPRNEIDRNTYSLFNIEDGTPTYAYELDTAIDDKYLVPPKGRSIALKYPTEGIKYNQLSVEDREEYEEKMAEAYGEDNIPEEVKGSAFNGWFFNTSTQDLILTELMENGIKVDDGDKIGKTIIFARNHRHAEFIKERFDINYPQYGPYFCQVIHNKTKNAQDLLERFCDEIEVQEPQIAVSVDMMDTGVDAPMVLNLVFAKLVRSHTKYWQMIGRGTRLCEDLLGIGEHKKEFMIFDCCGNFEYFEDNLTPKDTALPKSISQKYFETLVDFSYYLLYKNENTIEEERELAKGYIQSLCVAIKELDQTRIDVRQALEMVIKYSRLDQWSVGNIANVDTKAAEIKSTLSGLYFLSGDQYAKQFDLLVLYLQYLWAANDPQKENLQEKVIQTATTLESLGNIPAVQKKLPFIRQIKTDDYWTAPSQKQLERIRTELRDLIRLIPKEDQKIIYTAIKGDFIIMDRPEATNTIIGNSGTGEDMKNYREKVYEFFTKNRNHTSIHKLVNNLNINHGDITALEKILIEELGTQEEYKTYFEDKPYGQLVRETLGLSDEAVDNVFYDFVNQNALNVNQRTMLEAIKKKIKAKGIVEITEVMSAKLNAKTEFYELFEMDDLQTIKQIILNLNNNVNPQSLQA
ncbi:DEAD/DEAH box helicase family protein [Flammeovirga kamogawensis]|uniref:DEAD/DEAH box helicase family protein n=1 Tax=Flammeovirga kamogawensis TaxID=373891 RepID=A0ABX8H1N3_9BACT|nr:DEAD/DEAH box helicase family protein [Flammeovirga kamogawensis]MBB6462268.1 type I restriction enzyme R subunit [Flammeovirga kamogawensis]QWG09336.1 DEAD/DEAH box helicase family protein [Flammeovirga kamogawensis]TRX64858.1 DEAD/DEAH box helicase [Flammeovirga kamogawensis]